MAKVIFLLVSMLSVIAEVKGLLCVCNKDSSNQVTVFDSQEANTSIGYLDPHQCGQYINTDGGLLEIQFKQMTAYVANDTDLVSVTECTGTIEGSTTTGLPLVSTSSHGCHSHHISKALQGNVNLCPQYVVLGAKTHCNTLTQHGHNCYEVSYKRVSWTHAKQICTERGGHLVTIHNAQENSYLHHVLTQLNYTGRVWIGLQDRTKEGHYHWVTGESVSYTHWSNHANHGAHNNQQDCVTMLPTGQWEDVLCGDGAKTGANTHIHAYICEYNAHGSGSTIIG